jgi:hypothetical protein
MLKVSKKLHLTEFQWPLNMRFIYALPDVSNQAENLECTCRLLLFFELVFRSFL